MEKAKYYLKMELTMSQIGDKMHYTKAQREEVRGMVEFVGLFYARWFFMSAKSESMPWTDCHLRADAVQKLPSRPC